jgi:hypothetical protein
MEDLNFEKACMLTFSNDSTTEKGCEAFNNGLMKGGLKSTVSYFYYYQLGRFVIRNSYLPIQMTSALIQLK